MYSRARGTKRVADGGGRKYGGSVGGVRSPGERDPRDVVTGQLLAHQASLDWKSKTNTVSKHCLWEKHLRGSSVE